MASAQAVALKNKTIDGFLDKYKNELEGMVIFLLDTGAFIEGNIVEYEPPYVKISVSAISGVTPKVKGIDVTINTTNIISWGFGKDRV